ncbi:glutathione S-transferase [Cryptosporidium felis]|nr:glutathione S-transferase [Cryptosporidium felis]
MNSAINSWTSGIANFLNMGRGQRENMTEMSLPNQGGEGQHWGVQGQGQVGGFLTYQNVRGFSPNNPYQQGGNQFISPVEYSQFAPNIPNFTTAAFTSISGLRQIVSITDIGSVVAHYYDLGKYLGLGGAIRFFMLCKQIKHSFVNISLNDENVDIGVYSPSFGQTPGFSYPLVIHNGKYHLFGTVPTLRYISKKVGEYGIDVYRDYVLDIFSEKLSDWRSELLLALLEKISEGKVFQDSKEEATDNSELSSSRITNFTKNIGKIIEETKRTSGIVVPDENYYKNYIKHRRGFFKSAEDILSTFSANPFISLRGEFLISESEVEKREPPRQFCNSPSYSELLLFSIIYDDSILIKENSKCTSEDDVPTEKLLEQFPKIQNLFKAVMAYPLITQWYREVENPQEAEGSGEHPSNKTSTVSRDSQASKPAVVRVATPKKKPDFESPIFNTNNTSIPLNEPHTSNTVTYRLAPPKSQVIFPSNQRADAPNLYHQAATQNPSANSNTFNAIRISNYDTSFRPSNPQPSVNVRIANFSQVNNLRQFGQNQVSTARQFANLGSDQPQNTHYQAFAPSTFR